MIPDSIDRADAQVKPSKFIHPAAATAVAALLLSLPGDAQRSQQAWPDHEFEFARLIYYDGGRCHVMEPCWTVDYPEAEDFFAEGVSRLSRVNLGREGVMVQFGDDTMFSYPWLYAVEVGHWYLNDAEAAQLREYLLRGGFLMVDDFHGQAEWAQFMEGMNRVFPDRPVVDIEDGAEVLHVVYDVDERIQIPGIYSLMQGTTYENGGVEPHWRGIYDDHGRLMVAINHNMDLGDSWELADRPDYPQEMTTLGLRFAVNYVIYAMTH